MVSEEMERDAAALQQQAEELLKKKADVDAALAKMREPLAQAAVAERAEAARKEREEIQALLALPRDDSRCDCGYLYFPRFGMGGPRYHARGCASEVRT